MIHLKMKRWREQLTELIDQLDEGSIALIEFGNPKQPASDFSTRIRIRLTKTPAGLQFGMRFVYSFRGEGSGSYYPRNTEGKAQCIRDAMKEVETYTAETPLAKKLKEVRERSGLTNPHQITDRQLAFTGFVNENHLRPPVLRRLHAQEEAGGRGFLPDAVVIRLKQE
jgi:hypothetical protein